jgi:nicotinamidase-related amidase
MIGMPPERSATALLLIDFINDFEFEGAERMFPDALAAAKAASELRLRAKAAGVPVVYCNDNFGRWRSDFRKTLAHCLEEDVRGKPIAELLKPGDEDYFVLKPKHSGFESTSLDILLSHLRVGRLVLTGIAGDFCVLFTAHDAYMRGYELLVPGDCTASDTAEDNRAALRHMAKVCKADIRPSSGISFEDAAKGQGQISLSRRASR